MTFTPAAPFIPDFWTITSHDIRHADRNTQTAIGTNTAWIANLAVYVPITIDIPCTVYEWFWLNGTLTTAHNIDFGIYNADFTKVQSLGSTVGTTTASTIINTSTWTDLALVPGTYYMAFANDSTRNFTCSADAAGIYQACGIVEQTTAFALPSPAVPVAYTRAFLPFFGMNLRSTAI